MYWDVQRCMDESNVNVVTLLLSVCLFLFYHHLFLMVFLSEGRGQRKARLCCQICQSSRARPLPPPRRHYILLVLVLLATVPQQQSHGNRAPRQQRAVSPQWSCHWADQRSGTTPRADRDLTDKNWTIVPADRRYCEGGSERFFFGKNGVWGERWWREGERRCNRVQRGEAGGREGWRGSAVKDAWSLLE